MKTTAIVLAAGQGKRMQSKVAKQYLLLNEYPVLYYSLKAFEDSFVDDVILVVGKGEIDYCKSEIVDKYGFDKVRNIVEGGKERYHSVACGLESIDWPCEYVFIHDGARPFLTDEILSRALEAVCKYKACVVGMPVKDTIKIADESECVDSTPNRSKVWQVQTPQTFEYENIKFAYRRLLEDETDLLAKGISITDDAFVWERYMDTKVKLVKGSYQNIKITTPEDIFIGETFLNLRAFRAF